MFSIKGKCTRWLIEYGTVTDSDGEVYFPLISCFSKARLDKRAVEIHATRHQMTEKLNQYKYNI